MSGADLNLWRQNFGVNAASLSSAFAFSLDEADTLAIGDEMAAFTYDPETGELSVDADDQEVWSINVATLADSFATQLPAAWASAEFDGELEWTDPSAGGAALDGTFALGTLESGLNASDFGRVLYFTNDRSDAQFATVQVVPEPATVAVLGLGGLMIATRRRRGA